MRNDQSIKVLLQWCSSQIGPCQVISEDQRFHGRSSVYPLQTKSELYYLKIHQEHSNWNQEVHGYEKWAPAFGPSAPELIAVHEKPPYALIISALPGKIVDHIELPQQQEEVVWHAAGRALSKLHNLASGTSFGPCNREGFCINEPILDAQTYISLQFKKLVTKGLQAGYINHTEHEIIKAVEPLISSFAGEVPTPCHRDYGPANWLVHDSGHWTGVIDFEMAYWDVRVADFSRYPNWEWIHKPSLLDAFFNGYGRTLTAQEEEQCLVARIRYALDAIRWGTEHAYFGFVEEGRQALKHLGKMLG